MKIPAYIKWGLWVLQTVPIGLPLQLRLLIPALEKLIELLPDHKQVAARNELPTAHADAVAQNSHQPVTDWFQRHCEGGTCTPPSSAA